MNYNKKAAKLGSAAACRSLGNMHQDGTGCAKDNRMAIEYFRQAIEYGDNTVYGVMMMVYFAEGHFDNAFKCWDRYVNYINEDSCAATICQIYIQNTYKNNSPIKNIKSMLPFRVEIIKAQNDSIERAYAYKASAEGLLQILTYMEYIFKFESDEGIVPGLAYTLKRKQKDEKIIFAGIAVLVLIYFFFK